MPTGNRRFGLSKTKITKFEQCSKRLWLSVHRPELGDCDDGSEARFATGNEVGNLACVLLPDGIMVEVDPDLAAALDKTQELLALRPAKPIFEATLQHDGVLVRIDVLEPLKSGGWRMAEVKSSGGPKPYHHGDLATQLWVARNCGLRIRSACIRHLNTSFVLQREGDYAGLFADTELMADVEGLIASRDAIVRDARKSLSGDEPDIGCGDHCTQPFACEFDAYCRSALPPPPEWSVDVLCNGGGKKWRKQGIEALADVDANLLTSLLHQRIHQATVSATPFHDLKGAAAAMKQWSYPRTWLDFETIGFAIPRWVGTRPYQQVPFQFSAHVESRSGAMEHHEFLSLDGKDPRRACAEALVAMIPGTGTVIAYNVSFERGQVTALAAAFPDLAKKLLSIAARLVDLLPIARAHWYHRDQRGSWSIKAVLPTVSDLDYSALEVNDGNKAQEAYLEAVCPDCSPERKAALSEALKVYCGRDTLAMIMLARALGTESKMTPEGNDALVAP